MNLKFHRLRIFFATGAFSVLLGSFLTAEDKPQQYGLIFEGSFAKADIASEIEGAKKTQLVAAHTTRYGMQMFTDESWKKSGLEWENFSIRAGVVADRVAKALKPVYVRNRYGVIDYASATGKDPFLTSAITSPHFIEHFVDTLGDKVHVIVIDRHILYIFPATGGRLAKFGPSLVNIFKTTPLPVSLEVFEVDKNGYKVIGEIQRPKKQVLPK